MIAFTNTQRQIINLNTNTTYTDSAIATSVNAIGEKKRLKFTYTSDISIEGYVFYINLALFMPKGAINPIRGKGDIYWVCQIPDTVTPNATLQAYLSAGSSSNPYYTQKNLDVQVKTVSSTEFQIIADFYMTYDLLGYMNSAFNLSNVERLLKDRYNNSQSLVQSGSSIYGGSVQHDGRVYLYAEYFADDSDWGSIETLFGDFRANFYGAFPSAYNPGNISLTYYANSVPADTIQADINTQVQVLIYSPDHVPTLAVNIFKVNNNDQTVDFVENYSLETSVIDASAENQDLLIQPMVSPISSAPNYYIASFTINADNVEPGDMFYIGTMVYDPTGEIVSSYINRAPDVSTERPFNGNGFTMTGTIGDIENDYSGQELTCVVEERMVSKVELSYPADQFRNDILNRLGVDIGVNDVAYFLTRIKFRIYEEYVVTTSPDSPSSTYRNYFIEREMVKERGNPNIWGGQTSNFAAISSPNALQLLAYWRNGYESHIDCLRSTIDDVDYGQKLVTQNWSGKDLFVEWELLLDYARENITFQDKILYTQKIHVNGYTNDVEIKTQDPTLETNSIYDTVISFCNNANVDLQAEFTEPAYENYRLITNIEPDPGNSATIEEAEAFSPGNISQLTSTKITSQEHSFGQTAADKAKFSLVAANLQALTYKVSAIAKKQ